MAGPTLRAFREHALYHALLIVTAIGRRIPLPLGRFLGRMLGRLAWYVARRERNKALANIAIAFPDWSDAKRQATIRGMFRHLGMMLFEIAWMPNLNAENRDETTIFEGLDRVLELIDEGRGVVVFTAHCGNWEWISFGTGTWGRPVSVLQRERDHPEMNRYITELRAKAGVRSIDRGSPSSARDMIQALRRGGILAFAIDQNIRTDSVQVPFFGRPAQTPIGPARITARTEAIAVLGVAERRPDGKHIVRYLEPMEVRRGDDPVELTARITAQIEAQIRRAPEQWMWMHDRWRYRPQWDVETKGRPEPAVPEK